MRTLTFYCTAVYMFAPGVCFLFYLQVIPQPAFMAKPDAVWSEEERRQFKDYEKKVKELNEERDKYRKVRRAKN